MSLDNIILLAIAISLLCFKPGPGMMTIISRALNSGFIPASAMILGIVSVEAAYFILAITSYGLIEQNADFIAHFMKSIAAVYFVFLGVKGLLEARLKGNEVLSAMGKKAQLGENFAAGAMVTACNPYVILFYATVVPGILEVDTMTLRDHLIALSVITGINLLLLNAQALLASYIKDLFKQPLLIIRINQLTSSCFIGIGLFLAYTLLPVFAAQLGVAHF